MLRSCRLRRFYRRIVEQYHAIRRDYAALDILSTSLTFPVEQAQIYMAVLGLVSRGPGIRWMENLSHDDALLCVDLLDDVAYWIGPHERQYPRIIDVLTTICAINGLLPSSYTIDGKALRKVTSNPAAHGGFADVWEGRFKKEAVALKVIRIPVADDVVKIRKRFAKEVIHWKTLRHPNITPLLGVNQTLFPYCMVSPWTRHGNISRYLRATENPDRLKLLQDVASGLSYLHMQRLVHGDLKGANILVNNEGHACLTDFGLSALVFELTSSGALTTTYTGKGTVRWMAPELLDPESFGMFHARLSRASDVYSLAMVMWEVYSGRIPFHGITIDAAVIHRVTSGVRPERPPIQESAAVSELLWDIMQHCWNEDRGRRPNTPTVHGALVLAHMLRDGQIRTATFTDAQYMIWDGIEFTI